MAFGDPRARPEQTAASTARSAAARSAAVHLTEIRKAYGGVTVLNGVSMQIEAGEFVTLLGPSGSGKTSMLMAVAGFVTPDSGRILVGGRDVTHLPPGRDRDMGIVFQNYALFPHMSVAANVAYPLRVRGVSRAEMSTRVKAALERVQLTALADRKPARLSGGQQQRVALARAMVFEPSVLLMDEPMGALDVRLKEELQWEVRQLQRSLGATVIYVTHDQNEAMLLSDRVALMRDGQIEQYGSPQQLYKTPETVFTARFLGDSNLIDGSFVDHAAPALRVDATQALLPATRAASRPAGTPCSALLRPEHLCVMPSALDTPMNATSRPRTSFDCHVTDVVFLGQSIRCTVHVPALARDLIVQQPSRHDSPDLRPGMTASVSWDPADVHLIDRKERDAFPRS